MYRRSPVREYTTISADSADTTRARELNAKGAQAWRQGKLEKAERHYRDALIADVNFGPAHNNLGHLYLAQQQLYLAAWEFELAANTLPGRIEPLINLGLVYEHAQRFDVAEDYYRQALEINPRSAAAIAHLVRLMVRSEGDGAEINHLLHELLLYDNRETWRNWGNELLATRYRDEDCCQFEIISDLPTATGHAIIAPLPSSSPLPMEIVPSPESESRSPELLLAPPVGRGSDSILSEETDARARFSVEDFSSPAADEQATGRPASSSGLSPSPAPPGRALPWQAEPEGRLPEPIRRFPLPDVPAPNHSPLQSSP